MVKKFKAVLITAMLTTLGAVTVVGQPQIYFSPAGLGQGASQGNPSIRADVGTTGSVYIWVDDELQIDSGAFLDVINSDSSVVNFTGVEVFNPEITVAGTSVGQRWEEVLVGKVSADFLRNFGGLAVSGGTGIVSENTGVPFIDSLYDATAGAFLFARLDYDVVGNGIAQFDMTAGEFGIVNQGTFVKAQIGLATFVVGQPVDQDFLLSDLIANDGRIIVGEKEFCEFDYSPIGDMPSASDIIVSATDTGIRFQGAFLDLPGNGPSDALIDFKVKTSGCAEIIAAELAANPLVIGDGFFSITETFLPTESSTSLAVYDIQPAGITQLIDSADLENPVQTLCVQKDIIAWAQDDTTLAVMSFLDQNFECSEGEPGPGVCSAGRPNFDAEEFLAFGDGQLVANTQFRCPEGANCFGLEPTPVQGVLNVFDLSNPPVSGPGSPGSNWSPNSYTHPDWFLDKMGQVFGVTIDDQGNIYTAHTAIYFADQLGSIGGFTPGQIYKIDAQSGAVSVFATLENTHNPALGLPGEQSNAYPGLGNLCFDAATQNIFVSNFRDGLVYRLDMTGQCLSAWNHPFTGESVTGRVNCPPLSSTIPGQAAALGNRVWAVQVHQGRMYYSVWWEDSGAPNATRANEIWSVAIDSTGDFVDGTERMEIEMPPVSGSISNPVADIAFSPEGFMLCAERTMFSNSAGGFGTSAHSSRAIEFFFSCEEGGWTTDNTSSYSVGGGGQDAVGGCEYSFESSPENRVWVTSDRAGSGIYGLQGLPKSGGGSSTSRLIDSDGAATGGDDKTQLGSLALSCSKSNSPVGKRPSAPYQPRVFKQ